LYGRYWGCLQEYNVLHFEACYYQGIDYCIEHGLARFDSGAQGEHKIARGFEPVTTYSAHWFRDERFAKAIAQFLLREKSMVDSYKDDATRYLPFKITGHKP
jgi:predicted N-acyltransferase